jgi:hypothetical protein
MGGAFAPDHTGMHPCVGDDVMKELKAVFEDPGTQHHPNERYANATQNNSFDQVQDAMPGNWRALVVAYADAGCDVCGRWAAYLRKLGSTAEGQHDIWLIAQARSEALRVNRPMMTTTHDTANGDPRAHVHKGDPNDHTAPTTINAPFAPGL